jgi:methyl-accepting chemotaxis protein/methyl-accepting chemotaxis protein-1 (serine sensor receptor)
MQSLNIGKKLLLGVGALVVLLGILSFVLLNTYLTMKKSLSFVVDHQAVQLRLAGQLQSDIWALRAAQRGVQLYTYSGQPALADSAAQLWSKSFSDTMRTVDEIVSMAATPETKAQVEQAKSVLAQSNRAFEGIQKACAAGHPQDAMEIAARSTPVFNQAVQLSEQMLARQVSRLEEHKRNASRQESSIWWAAMSAIALALATGIGVLFAVQRIGKTLRHVAAELADGAEQVAGAASQVSASSQSLALGASEQSASLEETSSSTEEINSMTHKNSENSQASRQLMAEVAEQIRVGNDKLAQMVSSMQGIRESSEKISGIIKVIDEIAFQTNILALNAAVEAARAGEAGMGFAVVADEVRNLAQRCSQAAKDTAALIEESIAKSNAGARKLEEVTGAMAGVTANTNQVKNLVAEVSLSSQEQVRGLDQVSRAIAQMGQVTEKTAASAEQSAAASEELNAQSENLRSLVNQLVALVGSSPSGGHCTTQR